MAKLLLIFFGALIISMNNSYAYIDPGTGSIVLQAVLAAVFSSLVGIKIFWSSILAFFRNVRSKLSKKS